MLHTFTKCLKTFSKCLNTFSKCINTFSKCLKTFAKYLKTISKCLNTFLKCLCIKPWWFSKALSHCQGLEESSSKWQSLAVVQSFLAHLCPDFQACFMNCGFWGVFYHDLKALITCFEIERMCTQYVCNCNPPILCHFCGRFSTKPGKP